MYLKIHESYRKIVAICDANLLGKKFEQGNLQIEVKESFYGGERKTQEEIEELMRDFITDDSTFNLVGEKTINLALRLGLIDEEGIIYIQGIPHAIVLI
jgi:hypothetical protein